MSTQLLPPGGALLDVGTGTGYIANTTMKRRHDVIARGVDTNGYGLLIAEMEGDGTFFLGDLYDALPDAVRYDVISITVPWEREEYENQSPREAYVDDNDVFARALVEAHDHLAEGGHVVVLAAVGFDEVFTAAGFDVTLRERDEENTAIYVLKERDA